MGKREPHGETQMSLGGASQTVKVYILLYISYCLKNKLVSSSTFLFHLETLTAGLAWLGKCLLGKHKDQSLTSRTHAFKKSVLMHTCNFSSGKVETGRSPGFAG